jgi:hypothetical protein
MHHGQHNNQRFAGETERDEIREGFYFGTINSRGTTVRAYDEGGDKERKLVDQYKEIANQLYFTHPKLASVFDDLASHYNFDAKIMIGMQS